MKQKIKLYAFLSLLYFVPRLVSLSFHFPPINLTSAYLKISNYWELSHDLLRHGILGMGGTKTTSFEPLYPLFLAGARWITGDNIFLVMVLQILIGLIGCLYLYELACLLSKNNRVGLITSVLYSLYPYLLYQTGTVTEITLFATLLIISAYYYTQIYNRHCEPEGRSNLSFKSEIASSARSLLAMTLLTGIFFGLTILTRYAALPIIVLALGALVVRKSYQYALTIGAIVLIILLPMVIRNYRIDGSLFLTRSGENLFEGNLEYSDKLIPYYNVDLLTYYIYGLVGKERPDLAIGIGTRKERDQFFTQKAFEFIKVNPWRTLKLKIKNVGYLFYPRLVPFHPMHRDSKLIWYDNGSYRVENPGRRSIFHELSYTISYGFIALTAMIGIYIRRKEFGKDLILYLIVFSFIVVYSLYFPTTRLRAPMDFILIFYSACTIESFLKRFKFQ